MPDYDVITVGGGLGGAALAKVMAEQGARVLVLEREHQFKDRIRGEFLAPWGGPKCSNSGCMTPYWKRVRTPNVFWIRWVLQFATFSPRLLIKFRRSPSIIRQCRT